MISTENGIGYKRPPRDKRFKPGKTGNERGRPKRSMRLEDILSAESSVRLAVTGRNGKRQIITKQELMARRVINQALEGKARSIRKVVDWARMLQDAGELLQNPVVRMPRELEGL